MMNELLDLVNENDEIIGQIERSQVDDTKNIIRIVYVGFYTPNKEIILQKRSLTKTSNPGKYTTSVSGHVESGWSYEDTAIKEAFEETGIAIIADDLVETGRQLFHNRMCRTYAVPFNGTLDDLVVEQGDGGGFKFVSIHQISDELTANPESYTPYLYSDSFEKFINYVKNL